MKALQLCRLHSSMWPSRIMFSMILGRKSTVTPAVAHISLLRCPKSPWATPWSLETLLCKVEMEYRSQAAVLSSRKLNSWMATWMLLLTMCWMQSKVDCSTPARAIYQSPPAHSAIVNRRVVRSTGKQSAPRKYCSTHASSSRTLRVCRVRRAKVVRCSLIHNRWIRSNWVRTTRCSTRITRWKKEASFTFKKRRRFSLK